MSQQMPSASTEQVYRDYWAGHEAGRKGRGYYARLYARLRSRFDFRPGWKVLDVAGGSGELLQYLEIRQADILDISDSGLDQARSLGYRTIKGNVEERFPVEAGTYDAAICFEVLEHLRFPARTLAEIFYALKKGGILYVAQPNMRPDGIYHLRRFRLEELLSDLGKCGFEAEWIDFVPAYSVREAIASDILRNPSWLRKGVQCINLMLSFLPYPVRYAMAKLVPDRFALLFVARLKKR